MSHTQAPVAPFGRVLTAMVTPFSADGELDLPLAARLAEHLVNQGSDGLVVCGTTGESPTLSWAEQHALFAAVKGALAGRATLIAGSGSNCTAEAVEATREAAALGADGALVVVPYYNKPPQDGLEAHFRAVAGAAPELPLMLYNIPGRTGTSLEAGTVARLLDCPNVVSFKAASGSTEEVSALRATCGDRLAIYCGDDALTLPMLAVGAVGVVSVASHLVGPQISALIRAFFEGDHPGLWPCTNSCCRCAGPSSAPPIPSPSKQPWSSVAGRWVPPVFPFFPPTSPCANASLKPWPPCVLPDAKA